jgi:hypothetical protein
MLKNMIGAFLGAKAEKKSGNPLVGAAVGATAVAIAKRSLPVAIGLAVGVAGMELLSRYRSRSIPGVPAFD